jgi:hypothetical protein
VDPARMPGLTDLGHGNHATPAGVRKGVHKVTVGMSGCGKGQTDVNYAIQHHLERSDEHLVVVDAKANAELSKVARAYMRPEDRLYVYSMHSADPESSALRLFADPDRLADVAFMLCDEQGAADNHWNDKASELVEAVARALTALKAQAERAAAELSGAPAGGREAVTASLNDVRDHVADKEKLLELRRVSPTVANVADNEKEWGYIRSTAARRLKPLQSPTLRRVFAAGGETEQPDFGPSPDGGRTVVVVRPDPKTAKRLTRYVYAVLDVLYRLAAAGGEAGGPGTKVVVDEAASYVRLDNLGEYLDLGRGSRVQLHYVLQSVKQLVARLGPHEAEHVVSSTEIKILGATSDAQTAAFVSRISGRSMVHYRGPRRDGEFLGEWRETERPTVTEGEITSQTEGEWTVQHGGAVIEKAKVERRHYHHVRALEPKEHGTRGVAAGDHSAPPLLGASAPDERGADGGPEERDDDDILD